MIDKIYTRIARGIVFTGIFFIFLGAFAWTIEMALGSETIWQLLMWLGVCLAASTPLVASGIMTYYAWRLE